MIDKIEMCLPNYILVIKNNICIINDKNVYIDNNTIDDILGIIRLWKDKYGNNPLRNNNYYIRIYSNDEVINDYSFNGSYPKNFKNLLDLVGDIYDRR
jgi:hypothetical protein